MEISRAKMDQLVSATRSLFDKVQNNERAASGLMTQCETLQQSLRSTQEYQGSIQALGQGSSNRRQLVEIEGAYVQQLQVENSELKVLLEEHQSALELIMSKYRSQIQALLVARNCDRMNEESVLEEELERRKLQLHCVAQTIQKALDCDREYSYCTQRRLSQLEFENKSLRELLSIASEASVGSSLLHNSVVVSSAATTDTTSELQDDTTLSSPKSLSLSPHSSNSDSHRHQVFNTLYGSGDEPQFKSTPSFINDNDECMPVTTTPAVSPLVSPHLPGDNNAPSLFTAANINSSNRLAESSNDLEEDIDDVITTDSFDSGSSTPLAAAAGTDPISSSNNSKMILRRTEEYVSNR